MLQWVISKKGEEDLRKVFPGAWRNGMSEKGKKERGREREKKTTPGSGVGSGRVEGKMSRVKEGAKRD